jgi:4-amino-4-deoxy-L-arabinose transferase-like glycosyltransferase
LAVGRWQLVVLVAALYVAPLLLDAPLTDPDEGLHAAISQEMVARRDFVVPRFLGSAFFDKPILFFWAQAASIAAFGSTTWAARLPGAIFALLGIATTGWLAGVLMGRDSGFGTRDSTLAAGCYATMALPFMLAQVPVHDMALVPFLNLAIGWLWRARLRPGFPSTSLGASGIRDSGFAGIALGLSILTKGLEGVAIVGVAYGAYLIATGLLTPRLVVQALVVLTIAGLVALPWYLAMNAREPAYLRYYFVDRHLLGFATDTQRHGERAWWYYLPIVLGGALPWILWLRGTGHRGSLLLLWTWLMGTLVLLSLSGSKALTYLLPAMPAIAILAAASITNIRIWRIVAIATAATYAVVLIAVGPSMAKSHSARDLADYFNATGHVPATVYTMDDRVSFVYYLKPELRQALHDNQVRSLIIEDLEALNPFPKDAVVALPADLAAERVPRMPGLARASWQPAGRYVVITPGFADSSADRTPSPEARR